jgi:hypothetical protein
MGLDPVFWFLSYLVRYVDATIQYFMENARGSPLNVLLAFSQSYVKHNLRKNKIVVASTTSFFRH